MKRLPIGLVSILTLISFTHPAAAAGGTNVNGAPLAGFSPAGAAEERKWEQTFDETLKAEHLREWMQKMTAHPHHLGSPYGKALSEFIAGLFRSWGYDTQIEEFQVLFPTPKTRLLEMTGNPPFTAALTEPVLAEDGTSGQTAEQLPTYNAYSIDGDVTGKLVYVNYGVPKDYEALAERGIDVKGRIVLARYGGSWRGIKVKVAAEHGAVGCLIYSDPRDDGFYQGDAYPKGAWRNENGAQRGSVADMPLYSGDPLTPGVGATKDATRLPVSEAATLTKIPVLPISAADALPLLRALGGPVAPEDWRGGLPVTYHVGPGTETVHLKVEFNWDMATARDVVAKLRGQERPNEWIIRGNHYDAWVCGADDPVSGTVAMLEEARALAELHRQGWQPKRTIVFATWDGEEPGLLGSTEWVETHAELLQEVAAVYVNSDSNQRGFLHAGGSHTLEKFMNEVARDVTEPERKVRVAERAHAQRLARAGAGERREVRNRVDARLEALGSGSDFTPFLQHLGIASLNLGYGGEGNGGSYHSIYDSFDHFTRFCDPDFAYGIALAQTAGRVVMRLADADVLPLEFGAFADTLDRYVGELVKLADDLREETREKNRLLREHTFELAADPRETYVAPEPKSEVPFVNFAPLQNAAAKLQSAARAYAATTAGLKGPGGTLPPADLRRQLDTILLKMEQVLLRPEGLPRRPWYQHMIYAPGFYTGYGVKTLPGVREALEERNWTEVAEQVEATARVLENYALEIDRARKLIEPPAATEP